MKSSEPNAARDVVYVVGAGFSAGLRYPLTKSLLIDVWSLLEESTQKRLGKVMKFHHPAFDPDRKTTFPDIEQLLTELAVNLELFEASRPAEGTFRKDELQDLREDLLSTIAKWFHELHKRAIRIPWLSKVTERCHSENAAIVSFNWDLILDQQLFANELGPQSYGLAGEFGDGPVLLKPHGSLNWYGKAQIVKVAAKKHVEIFHSEDDDQCVEAFLPYREIRSKSGRRYTPLIVPPTYLKDFNQPMFRLLWNRCTEVLSTAKEIIFMGYSLPVVDLHAQFIFRCGFHNQIEGKLRADGGRDRATGAAKVTIVNPDQEAARRIEAVAGRDIQCDWIPKRIEDWLDEKH